MGLTFKTFDNKLEYSKYQECVFTAVCAGENCIIDATAGSGKSTTIREAVDRRDVNSLVLSFNKSIADENKAYFDNSFTFHSYGMRLIKQFVNSKIKVVRSKVYELVLEMWEAGDFVGSKSRAMPFVIIRMINFYRSNYLEGNDIDFNRCLEHLDFATGEGKIEKKKVQEKRKAYVISNMKQILRAIHTLDYSNEIDMNDMVRIPAIRGLYSKIKFDLLVVDEVQDLDILQIQCLFDFKKGRDNQILLAGDPAQAIYGFRGAWRESMSFITKELDLLVLPLPITYRCQSEIVKYLNGYLESKKMSANMEHVKIGGEVIDFEGTSSMFVDYFKERDEDGKKVEMVISATNQNLLELFFELKLRHGYLPKLKGFEVGPYLKNLYSVEKLNTLGDLGEAIGRYKRLLVEEKKKFNAKSIIRLKEKLGVYTVVLRICKKYGYKTVKSLFNIIGKDARKKTDCNLFTVHASKGLEATHVAVVDEWFGGDQTDNLRYVAFSRCKESLIVWGKVDAEE